MYLSVNTEILNERISDLLLLYHSTFNKFVSEGEGEMTLRYKDMEMNWEYFLTEWEKYRHIGLLCGLRLIPLMCWQPTNDPINDDNNKSHPDFVSEDKESEEQMDLRNKMWSCRHMREKLINLIDKHVPE